MLGVLVVAALLLGVHGASSAQNILSRSVDVNGYPLETYNVTTEDGYILGLHRIPYGKKSKSGSRKVVFLMHGATFGSNQFTYTGPKYAMAYNFADAGFDVWMGNARGNSFSRRHVSLDPDVDDTQFFDFTYEDIATSMYDLPAMFDYVLNTTGQKKFYYVGYSQGGSLFYVLNSMSSAYHSKIAAAHVLAGFGYQNNLPNMNAKLISQSVDVLYSVAVLSGIVEIAPSTLTSKLMEVLVGADIPSGIIVGAAVKQLMHFVQNMRDKTFCSWNYGILGNVAKYGRVEPPAYNLSNINIDVTIHYSLGDMTQAEADALAMAKAMPRARARKVPRETFNHIDYLANNDAKELVTDYIIKSIKKL